MPTMSWGRTWIHVRVSPVAALTAARTACAEEILGNSANPFAPKGPKDSVPR